MRLPVPGSHGGTKTPTSTRWILCRLVGVLLTDSLLAASWRCFKALPLTCWACWCLWIAFVALRKTPCCVRPVPSGSDNSAAGRSAQNRSRPPWLGSMARQGWELLPLGPTVTNWPSASSLSSTWASGAWPGSWRIVLATRCGGPLVMNPDSSLCRFLQVAGPTEKGDSVRCISCFSSCGYDACCPSAQALTLWKSELFHRHPRSEGTRFETFWSGPPAFRAGRGHGTPVQARRDWEEVPGPAGSVDPCG